MVHFLSPPLLWFLVGVACFVLELILPGFLVFFFGLGAWGTALAVFIAPGLPLSAQLTCFVAVSALTLVLLRARCQKLLQGKTVEADVGDDFVPENDFAEVIEAIQPPAPGRVKYGGSFWQATCDEPVACGSRVRVLTKNNLSLKVMPEVAQHDKGGSDG